MKLYMIATAILMCVLVGMFRLSEEAQAQQMNSDYRYIDFVDYTPEGLSEKERSRILNKESKKISKLYQDKRKKIMDQYRQDLQFRSNAESINSESRMYDMASKVHQGLDTVLSVYYRVKGVNGLYNDEKYMYESANGCFAGS